MRLYTIGVVLVMMAFSCMEVDKDRATLDFNDNWQFLLSADQPAEEAIWRTLRLPHDWSIEGDFSPDHPAGVGGGALPGGTGWYKKEFFLEKENSDKLVFVQFDGIYQNSTVWVNGQEVGNRPNGYISMGYDISQYVKFGNESNTILVKVANSPQPNSRWYSGSGIYRKVRLVLTDRVYIPQWGTYIKSEVSGGEAKVQVELKIANTYAESKKVSATTIVMDDQGIEIGKSSTNAIISMANEATIKQIITIKNPKLWSIGSPVLYNAVTTIALDGKVVDRYETPFGIRNIRFDVEKGFFLNDEPVKIKGVCLHHDLGALGAAFNTRAMERQLQIMQGMGVNAIRTSHNPPATELLDLCDRMGILVMDEMFDMWAKSKNTHDYSLYWEAWHERDLTDFILRDRNHPSIISWSIGNEIMEQYDHADSTGGVIAKKLAAIVRALDDRPIVTANNDISPDNSIIKFGGLDLVGYNYNHGQFENVLKDHPGLPFVATETNSSLATRGHYEMPSDSVRIWPIAWDKPFDQGNADHTVSAYDHVRAPWGSTQEDTWRIVKKHDFISGLFIWTGFDYLGEPTPYGWPSRSSYFGIVDLAGFPKDTYYMYQCEWTNDTVLHVFPHWNWAEGQEIDIWAYYNHADEVELFLNGESQGVKRKDQDDFHVMWRLAYTPGEVVVTSRKNGQTVKSKTIKTAGEPYRILLEADSKEIAADGEDLSFVTAKVMDNEGNIVPYAANMLQFEVAGAGALVGVDNGDPTSHHSMKGNQMPALHGLALAILQATETSGTFTITATSEGLVSHQLEIKTIKNTDKNQNR